jgi:hypothetical protein
MADKGIVVEDAASGESIACADLRNTDDDANSRIVQLVAEVTTPEEITSIEDGTPDRTIDFGTTGGKGGNGRGDDLSINSSDITSSITSNLIDIEDGSAFVIYGSIEVLTSGSTLAYTGIKVTPLLYPTTGTKVGTVLPGVMIRFASTLNVSTSDGAYESAHASNNNGIQVSAYSNSTIKVYPILPMVFPTLGAARVGLHVYSNQDCECVLDLYGYPLAGAVADASLVALHVQENHLSAPFVHDITS